MAGTEARVIGTTPRPPSTVRTSLLRCKRASNRDAVREERESAKNANGVVPLHTLLDAWSEKYIRSEVSR